MWISCISVYFFSENMKCTFNVIVIGKPSVGKSSLCRMYLKAQTLRSSPSSRLQIFYVPEYDTFLFDCDGQVKS